LQRVFQAFGRNSLSAAKGEERDLLTNERLETRARFHSLCREKRANAEIVVHLNLDLRAKFLGDIEIANLVIQAQSGYSHQQSAFKALRDRKLQSLFEIGGVLVRLVHVLRVRKGRARLGENRIEITHDEIRREASFVRSVGAAVGAQNNLGAKAALIENYAGRQDAVGNDESSSFWHWDDFKFLLIS
jgi:hypothetical protein